MEDENWEEQETGAVSGCTRLEVAQGSRKRPAKGVRTDRRAPLQDDFWQEKKISWENEQELVEKALTSQFGEISRAPVCVMPAQWQIVQHVQEK